MECSRLLDEIWSVFVVRLSVLVLLGEPQQASARLRVQNVLKFLVLLTRFSSQGRGGAGGFGGMRFVKMMKSARPL